MQPNANNQAPSDAGSRTHITLLWFAHSPKASYKYTTIDTLLPTLKMPFGAAAEPLLWVSIQEVLAPLPHFVIQLVVLLHTLWQGLRGIVKTAVQDLEHRLEHEGSKHLQQQEMQQEQQDCNIAHPQVVCSAATSVDKSSTRHTNTQFSNIHTHHAHTLSTKLMMASGTCASWVSMLDTIVICGGAVRWQQWTDNTEQLKDACCVCVGVH